MHALADWLVEVIRSVPSWAVYLVASAMVYAETATLIAGLLVPSEALLLAAGVAAGVGSAEITALIACVCVAAVAGDTTAYWIGRSSGHRITQSWAGRRLGEQRWDSARERIRGGGMVAVATGRWIGFVRTLVPAVAGMARMPMRRFWLADLIGACSWASTVLLVGYFAGAALGATMLFYAGVAAVVIALTWYGVRWLRDTRSHSTPHRRTFTTC